MSDRPVRRRRRPNYALRLVIVLAFILVVLLIVAALLPKNDHTSDPGSDTTAGTSSTTGTTAPPSTAPSSEATTAPTTEPSTVPTTEPPARETEPETEPPTVVVPETTAPETQTPTEPVITAGSAVMTPPTVSSREPSDPSFFDDAAFIGDSVTLMLRNYNTTYKALGKATFLCAGSYAVRHAICDVSEDQTQVINISYQGVKMRPEDALAACGAKKVFIMLGMNDIGLVGVDKTIENWGILIENIRATCPDIEIYIQSATPIYIGGEIGSLNNANMDTYNAKLKVFAEENGCHFIDVAMYMKDANGGLAAEYCSDQYVHFTDAGASCWAKVLRAYVGD